MPGTDAELLRALGRGESIASTRDRQGWDGQRFQAWWQAQLQQRLPSLDGSVKAPVEAEVTILRDARGIPHCFAQSDADLFVAYGYTMGLDRLFQLDMRRRKGTGRLAALIGSAGVTDDRVAHTIGLPDLALAELDRLDTVTRTLLDAFAVGVELAVASMGAQLPIEYALLGAAWEPWTALDCIASTVAWRWQFTGRPHVVAGPELLRRTLHDDALVEAILAADREADTATLPPDAPYPKAPDRTDMEIGSGSDSPPFAGDAPGSNNWVMSGRWSRSGAPLLASDPHMPYEWSSAFYEIGLHGGSFDAVGAGLVGVPGLVMGRNRLTAWGFTNNICSLRDIYLERPVDADGDSHEFDGRAVPTVRSSVDIDVRDGDTVSLHLARTERGPLIDDILPPLARDTGPVSMRWLGTEPCTWPRALLDLTRVGSVAEARAAVRGWLVPSFGLVVADFEGSIGFIATGRIPLRSRPSRTYRHGWDPSDRWVGLIPDDAMPQAVDPARGWLASNNNRPAPDDYPYPLSGTWSEGFRTRRVGRLIEALKPATADRETLTTMHLDVLTPRAEELLDSVFELVAPGADEATERALVLLRAWDGRATPESGAAAIFEVFYGRWAQAVMAERVGDKELADYLANWGLGLASRVLAGNEPTWLPAGRRETLARDAFAEALSEIEAALGPDIEAWQWGAMRALTLPHPLSTQGDLGTLLDVHVGAVGGALATLNNSGFEMTRPSGSGPDTNDGWRPSSGAGYRLEVDLGESPPAIWTVTLESQSATPGSTHYADQVDDFRTGRTHRLPLDRSELEQSFRHREVLWPDGPMSTTTMGGTAT